MVTVSEQAIHPIASQVTYFSQSHGTFLNGQKLIIVHISIIM